MKENYTNLAPEYLRTVLDYDPKSGTFVWRWRDGRGDLYWNSWNTRWAGGPALTGQSGGYCTGTINGLRVLAHRVAWAMHYGEWPETIDHINGDRSDNRIANLRNGSVADNNRNFPVQRRNKSGFPGVRFVANRGHWRAGYGPKHLGCFGCITAAVIARKRHEISVGCTVRQPGANLTAG